MLGYAQRVYEGIQNELMEFWHMHFWEATGIEGRGLIPKNNLPTGKLEVWGQIERCKGCLQRRLVPHDKRLFPVELDE